MEICFIYVSRRMQLLDVVVLPELAPGAPLRPARLASLDALRRPDRDSPSVPRAIHEKKSHFRATIVFEAGARFRAGFRGGSTHSSIGLRVW